MASEEGLGSGTTWRRRLGSERSSSPLLVRESSSSWYEEETVRPETTTELEATLRGPTRCSNVELRTRRRREAGMAAGGREEELYRSRRGLVQATDTSPPRMLATAKSVGVAIGVTVRLAEAGASQPESDLARRRNAYLTAGDKLDTVESNDPVGDERLVDGGGGGGVHGVVLQHVLQHASPPNPRLPCE
eukprot:186975-Hanusia_phi.AAC.1